MSVLKPILLVFLLSTAVQAQTGPEQPRESSRAQISKNTWEQREAQIKALKKELAQNPNSAEANYRLAKAYLREPILGTKDAIKYFQQAVALKPNYAEAYLGLGDAYAQGGMFHSEWKNVHNAVVAYRKAISIRPDYTEAYVALGSAYLDEGDADRIAADAFKEAIRIKPDSAEAYSGLGDAYESLGLADEAIAAYKQAIKLKANPKDRVTDLFGLQLIYMKLTESGARLDEYIDVVKQMIEISFDSPYSYFTLGDLYVRTGRAEEAIAAYKKGISIKPQKSANSLFPKGLEFEAGPQRLGEVYIKLGRYTEAIEPCTKAIQENPKNREAYRVLSDAYIKLGLTKEAVETGKQAVSILRDDPLVYYNLGLTYVTVGDKESATNQYNTLIEMAESATGDAAKRPGVIRSDGRVVSATEPSLNMQKSMIKLYADMLLKKINQQ